MSTEQNLDLLIQADSTGVKAGMKESAQAVSASTEKMQQATEKMASASKSAVQQMIESFKQMADKHREATTAAANDSHFAAGKMAESINNAVSGVKTGIDGMGNALGMVSRNFMALAAVAAGTGIFKQGIDESKKFTGEALGLSKSLGIAASEAAVLNIALGDVYVTAEDFTEISRGLTRQLKLNEDAINTLGVTTRDSNGHLLNQHEIIKNAGKVLEEYREGTDRNLAAQVIFGRGVQDAGKVIKAAGADMEGARQKAESLGLMLSENNVKDLKAYKAAMNDLDDSLMAIKKAVGDQVMPVFTELANWMASLGPAAVTVIKGAFGGLAATFWYVRNGVVVLWETINAMVITVAEPLLALSVAMSKAMQGDFNGAKEAITNISSNISAAWSRAMDEMTKSSEKTSEKVKNLFVAGDPTKTAKSGTKDFVNPKEKEPKDKEPKLMRGFEAELSELKVQYQEAQRLEGSFREFTKEQEEKFWEEKLAIVERGSEDEKAIRLKIAQLKLAIDKQAFEVELAELKNQMAEYRNNTDAKLRIAQEYSEKVRHAYGEESVQYKEAQRQIIAIHRQAAEQLRQIDDERAKTIEAYELDRIERTREESQLRTQLGMQTKEQELIQERQFEEQMYQIKFQALQDKLKLAEQDPDRNPVEVAKIHAQIEQLELQHSQRMRQIDQQVTLETQKDWTTMFSTIQSGMANVIKGVLSGTMTMGQAIKSLMQTVLQAVVNMIAQMIARWIAAKLIEMIWGKTAAKAEISANAGKAATAAMASVAAIPYVGWAMAPEVGAATYATAMSYGVLSARNGFDIPAGVNPMVQTHEREMILPQKQADVIRDMADNGGPGGGMTLVVQTLDVGGVKDFFRRNASVMAPGLRNLARNYTPTRS